MSTNKLKGIPSISKIPTSGRDSGTHSRSSSISNLTTTSDNQSEAGDCLTDVAYDLKIDDKVWVNGTKPGTLKFLGKTQFAAGIWAGVLLDEAEGKNDGSVAGIKYFSCEPLKGIFTRPQKLSKVAGMLPGTGDSTMSAVSPRLNTSASMSSSRASVSSITSVTSPRGVCSKLRINEKIVVSSTTGVKHGILRFVGETDFAKGEWAGIELDEPVGKNDGSVAGKRYFTCKMKHGLFAPLHKVSRAGGASVSRPSSVRGSPLVRSTSKDSLNSSISNCSRSSRVKLGVTSLTNTQKTRITGGAGIMTNSRALEEIVKEKEKYINQLLSEKQLERAEVVRIGSQYEQVETVCSDLKKQQQKIEEEKKILEEQLSINKRKVEDLQFQLEEEKITKSDLEGQLQQSSGILKKIQDFSNKNLGGKIVNIKEILEGKENLSEVVEEKGSNEEVQPLRKRVEELEDNIKRLLEEKENVTKEVSELKNALNGTIEKNEKYISSITTTIQEKDDIISNLKTELNTQLEKVTGLMTENQSLNDQIVQLTAQAKGETDKVMKELGEKVSMLNEELKTKSSQLEEKDSCIREKDDIIVNLNKSLEAQALLSTELENSNNELNTSIEQKDCSISKKTEELKVVQDEMMALEKRINSEIPEKEQKILGLVQEIEKLTNSLQEKDDHLSSKEKEICALQTSIKEMKKNAETMSTKILEAEEKVLLATKGTSEQIDELYAEITKLKDEKIKLESDHEKKFLEMQNQFKVQDEQIKNDQNQITNLKSQQSCMESDLGTKIRECEKLKAEIDASKKANSGLQDELDKISALQKENEENLQKVKVDLKTEIEKSQQTEKLASEQDSEIIILKEKISNLTSDCEQLRGEIDASKAAHSALKKETEEMSIVIKGNNDLISDLQHNAESAQTSLIESNENLCHKNQEITLIQDSLKAKEEESKQLLSRLQLAEQKVEMLNKDSSDHVMSLQEELSKTKEDNLAHIMQLEQLIDELRTELSKSKELETLSTKNLSKKDKDIEKLESMMVEKKSLFDELTKAFEASRTELVTLKESNENSIALLNSKESFIIELKAELQKQLEETEMSLKNDISKLEVEVQAKEEKLNEKDESISNATSQLKEQAQAVVNLNSQIESLQMEKEKTANEFKTTLDEATKKICELELNYTELVAEKEELIEKLQTELSQAKEIERLSTGDVSKKDEDIAKLKSIIMTKETQFDELTKDVEASQAQLIKLMENNENNVALLNSKEGFINEFKAEQQRKLQEIETSLKNDISKLEAEVQAKEEKLKQKDESILNATSQLKEQAQTVANLNAQIENLKVERETSAKEFKTTLDEVTNKLSELELNYTKLVAEKEELAEEELKSRDAKKDLELVRDSLMEENAKREEIVKNKETQLEALQAVVNRMQIEFTQHKRELEQKLDVSEMELQANMELKTQLELQHSVNEELQQELQNAEELRKTLENQAQKQLEDNEKSLKEKLHRISTMEGNIQSLEDCLSNSKNTLALKEKELQALNKELAAVQKDGLALENLKLSLKSLEEENASLKKKISSFESVSSEQNANAPVGADSNQSYAQEKESLYSQIDFLNSIIVDMKQKIEDLTKELELRATCWDESDVNLNVEKKLAPRLFCDICDMFDLHDTDDCPKQESFLEEDTPVLKPHGSRKLEERPYCNNCEVFGHWTFDCQEQETY